MEYLTITEISLKWKISNRMVAYYCQAGRIYGAVKKGKTWLIPVNAEKPVDKRSSKKKHKTCNSGERQNINKKDVDNLEAVYRTSDVYRNLGLTRETLRYYEEIGLISPKRSPSSQYRNFDFWDISHLMAIDFFKKRGFSPLEVKELMDMDCIEDYIKIMTRQIECFEKNIRRLQNVVKRLEAATDFCAYHSRNGSQLTVRDLPLYAVQETLDAVSSFEEYQEKVLAYLNLEDEDILSSLVRSITFDETGYKGSEMCIVTPATAKSQRKNVYLEDGRCLYTTLSAGNNDNSVMDKMFLLVHKWAEEHEERLKGIAYVFIRFVMLDGRTEQNFYEIWLPLK